MQTFYKPFESINYLSKFDQLYTSQAPVLRPFFKYDVQLEGFEQVILDKKKNYISANRKPLVEVLTEQYQSVEASEATWENINALLSDNTFTVTTAHQPSLLTGPLYFIYKTISTLNLAKRLEAKFPDYRFVPVFWSGGEDHDFDEIKSVRLFGKTLTWENSEQGATGLMSTDSLRPLLDELRPILGESDRARTIFAAIERAFISHRTYGEAMFDLLNELFKADGLVVLLSNHPNLKRLFIPFVKEEIFNRPSKALVDTAIQQKEAIGLNGQAFPRDVNFFYLEKNLRERIVFENGFFEVLNTDCRFTPQAIETELETHPERFSPNVIMRPIYQEFILPNLAYIGGGGELAYWTERIEQFDHFGVNFPMLVRRNSALWVDSATLKRLEKLNLSLDDLWGDVEELIKTYVKNNTDEELALTSAKQTIEAIFEEILAKALRIDPTLEKSVLGEKTKQLNALDSLETRLLRAEKRNQETVVSQIRSVKEKLFPANGLQERYDNFLPFYLKYGDRFFETLRNAFDPFNPDFVIILADDFS